MQLQHRRAGLTMHRSPTTVTLFRRGTESTQGDNTEQIWHVNSTFRTKAAGGDVAAPVCNPAALMISAFFHSDWHVNMLSYQAQRYHSNIQWAEYDLELAGGNLSSIHDALLCLLVDLGCIKEGWVISVTFSRACVNLVRFGVNSTVMCRFNIYVYIARVYVL